MNSLSHLRTWWTQWRELIFWPLFFVLSPFQLKRWVVKYVQNRNDLFAHEVHAMRVNVLRFLPEVDIDAATRELRLVHLTDRSDPFASKLFLKKTLRSYIQIMNLPPPNRPTLFLAAHRGNGWWSLPLLYQQGQPVQLVTAPLHTSKAMKDFLINGYAKFRWREINRIGGLPIIPARGASQIMRGVFSESGRVMAGIDVPSALAKQCSPVQFWGKTAYMPRQAIENAMACNAAIFYFASDFNAETLQQEIRFTELDTSGSAQSVFQCYISLLEKEIRKRPGSWHSWGHIDLYFQNNSDPIPS